MALASALLATACAAPPPTADLSSIEERLKRLEDRVNSLERLLTNLPSPPLRSRADIARNIQSLEQQRAALLERYTAAHPDVREIDLRLRLLRLQVDMLDQASRVPQ
jgi:chromosome segregation ATPase